MKTAKIVIISYIFALICGCGSRGSAPQSGQSDWVTTQIAQFQKAPVGNPPQSIWQYEYNGNIVYYIPSQCCDQFSQLYDADGKLLCAPDGGISGKGDGKCPEFFQLRKNEILIWRGPRAK